MTPATLVHRHGSLTSVSLQAANPGYWRVLYLTRRWWKVKSSRPKSKISPVDLTDR
jgi:hypothetical protein